MKKKSLNLLQSMQGQCASTPRKEKRKVKKRKEMEAQRVNHPTPYRATDALTGDKEQNGKLERTKRKKQGAGPHPSYPGSFSSLQQRAGIIQ